MLSRTNAQLLKAALNTERSVLDATAGRILRAKQTYAETDQGVEEFVRDASDHAVAASTSLAQLVDALDTYIRS